MRNNNLYNQFKELGWSKTNKTIFGFYNGYFFNISKLQVRVKIDNSSLNTLLVSRLNDKIAELNIYSVEIESDSILLNSLEFDLLKNDRKVFLILKTIVDLLEEFKLPKIKNCHFCSSDSNLDFYDDSNKGVLLCNLCFEKRGKIYKLNEIQGSVLNYLKGFLMSQLFSIIGIFIWVTLFNFIGKYAAVTTLIFPFLSNLGLRKIAFGGSLSYYILYFSNLLSISLSIVSSLTVQNYFNSKDIFFQIHSSFLNYAIIPFLLITLIWIRIIYEAEGSRFFIKLARQL